MQSHIAAIRAITAQFAQQFVRPFFWIGLGIIISLAILIIVMAVTISSWWWLAIIPVVILGGIVSVAWLLVRMILGRLSPRLDARQQLATKQFVTKLQFATETLQTPYPLIIFYVVRDILLRRDTGFINEVAEQSKTLRPDFEQLRKLF